VVSAGLVAYRTAQEGLTNALSCWAPTALLTLDFHHALSTGSQTRLFPAAAIERSLWPGR